MKRNSFFFDLLTLFLTFVKIGALTFGGGYAMIPIIHRDVVEKRKWLSQNEMLEVLAISESTPGPISVNAATYVGFRVRGFWGSFFATLGLIIPSFVIIFVISLFYKTFMTWSWVDAMFKGLKAAVIILLINAVIKLRKSMKLNFLTIFLFSITFIGMLLLTFFNIKLAIGNFRLSMSILFILFGIIFAISFEALSKGGNKE